MPMYTHVCPIACNVIHLMCSFTFHVQYNIEPGSDHKGNGFVYTCLVFTILGYIQVINTNLFRCLPNGVVTLSNTIVDSKILDGS
jgi:hypothetical protein